MLRLIGLDNDKALQMGVAKADVEYGVLAHDKGLKMEGKGRHACLRGARQWDGRLKYRTIWGGLVWTTPYS